MMNVLKNSVLIAGSLSLLVSCAVISKDIRSEANMSVSFKELIWNSDNYIGQTVILGGYILETQKAADETRIAVQQAPLGSRLRPKSKSLSQGRFMVTQKGLLDSNKYRRNRQVTVAGKLVADREDQSKLCPSGCIQLESRQIYLWPEHDPYLLNYQWRHWSPP